MGPTARIAVPKTPDHRPVTTITTTLYDVMAAVQEEVPPGAERLATTVVAELLNSGRIRFLAPPERLDVNSG
jgi:hypothetical protein